MKRAHDAPVGKRTAKRRSSDEDEMSKLLSLSTVPAPEDAASLPNEGTTTATDIALLPYADILPSLEKHPLLAIYCVQPREVYNELVRLLTISADAAAPSVQPDDARTFPASAVSACCRAKLEPTREDMVCTNCGICTPRIDMRTTARIYEDDAFKNRTDPRHHVDIAQEMWSKEMWPEIDAGMPYICNGRHTPMDEEAVRRLLDVADHRRMIRSRNAAAVAAMMMVERSTIQRDCEVGALPPPQDPFPCDSCSEAFSTRRELRFHKTRCQKKKDVFATTFVPMRPAARRGTGARGS